MPPPICGHPLPRQSRGLCRRCYMRLYRLERGLTRRSRFPVPEPEPASARWFTREPIHRVEPPRHFIPRPFALTSREFDALRSFAEYGSAKEAADTLGISVQTLKNHLTRVYEKTGSLTGIWGALHAMGWLRLPEQAEKVAA